MLGAAAENWPIIEKTFSEASDVLGYDLWHLCQHGPAEELNQTTVTQPALLAASVALWRQWFVAGGQAPDFVAGHSLGGALVAEGLKNYNLDADRIDFFNPGASPVPWSKDAVNEFATDKDAYFFMNAIDPVSLGQLGEKPQNLLLNDPQSWTNPIANHSIDQWFKMD